MPIGLPTLRRMLPSGRPLPERDWLVRHRAILWIVAVHAVGLFAFALVMGHPVADALAETLPLLLALVVAWPPTLSRRVRAGAATLGLMSSSAVLVHLGHGMTEMHFHFFVMLVVITFYQDWSTFLIAAAFVLVEHAVVGVIAPHMVYSHPDAWAHPVRWAGIHALFVTGAGVAAVVNWRFADQAQASERAIAERLAFEASHDPLTGALNRREFDRRLAAALADPGPVGARVLCFLDLDRFKIVNDSCGHAAGDALLCQVTTVIAAELGPRDVLARVGGDEFVVLLHALDGAAEVAERIRHRVAAHRFPRDGRVFTVGVSIGLVPLTGVDNPHAAMRAADAACYAAKHQGRNRVHVADADDRLDQHRGQAQWAERVMSAVDDDTLVLYYQPIVPITPTGEGPFGEILVRMLDDEGSLIGPAAFLPAAERYNLVTAIDRWVIGAVVQRLARRCRTAGAPPGETFSINLSGGSVGDEALLAFIRAELAAHRIPPRALCFEVTETVAIGDLPRAVAFITELRALGCRFALDDFGSGLSGFAYLKQLPVDLVKIDGSFVRDITTDHVDRAMVESVNRISHEMGLRTIAEFVEDADILDELRRLGVDYAQGYGTGMPVPFDDWLLAHPPRTEVRAGLVDASPRR